MKGAVRRCVSQAEVTQGLGTARDPISTMESLVCRLLAGAAVVAVLVVASPASAEEGPSFEDTVILEGSQLADWASEHGLEGEGSASDPYRLSRCSFAAGFGLVDTEAHLLVEDCTIEGQGELGNRSEVCESSRCGENSALLLAGVSNVTVRSSTMTHDGWEAVALVGASGVVLEGNTLQSPRLGLLAVESANNTVEGNVLDGSFRLVRSQASLFTANTVRSDGLKASVKHGAGNTLQANTIAGETPLEVQGSRATVLQGNEFDGGEVEVRVETGLGAGIFALPTDVERPSAPAIPDRSNRLADNTFTETSDLECSHADTWRIVGNRFLGADGPSVTLAWDCSIVLADNTFEAGDIGVEAKDTPGRVVLENNTFRDQAERGVVLRQGADGARVANNTFHGHPSAGLRVENGDDVVVDGNEFEATDTAILLRGSRGTEITGNEVNATSVGLHLGDRTSGIEVTGNHLFAGANGRSGSAIVIDEDGADETLVYDNVIGDGGIGGQPGPRVEWNVSARDETNVIGGPSVGGNHWCAPGNFDADLDGFGEIPVGPDLADTLPLVPYPTVTPKSWLVFSSLVLRPTEICQP
ncbi:hypothetical protein BRD56_07735 [Thermoplasmatales archaeon SW_10_69_26]|nr:MAG: hypothetical protein BRD56_07735 [Thermoplasmatales archaeon SW_10_69_26]